MRRAAWLMVLALAAVPACSPAISSSADEPKGTDVDLDGVKATTPADWKKEEPSNSLRWMQFRIPKAKDDKDDAELTITRGVTGGPDANVERWKSSFKPPSGKSIGDVAKVSEITIGGAKSAYLDVSGTYSPIFPAGAEPKPDYRMLAVYYEGKDNNYTFKLVGPAATVDAAKKGLDDWLKAFK